jgi:hypothetical protein
MSITPSYLYGLDNSPKKIFCSQCREKRAVGYVNTSTGERLPDVVARCDRENTCGYHYTPKQYFNDLGLKVNTQAEAKSIVKLQPEIIDYMPLQFIEKSMMNFNETNLACWIIRLVGPPVANTVLKKYFIGRSRNYNGKANIYWRIDIHGLVRTGKIMDCDPKTGKRRKDAFITWVHSDKSLQPFNYKLCFFGEHLIAEYPEKTIAIVESEKTAVIASVFMPDMVWIATGGNSGCKWREWSVFNVLKNRNVILFPDYGYFNKKTGKSCFMEWSDRAKAIQERMDCKIKVSSVLEDILTEEDRQYDYDLADMLIKIDDNTGAALTDEGYPVMWDFNQHYDIKSINGKYEMKENPT